MMREGESEGDAPHRKGEIVIIFVHGPGTNRVVEDLTKDERVKWISQPNLTFDGLHLLYDEINAHLGDDQASIILVTPAEFEPFAERKFIHLMSTGRHSVKIVKIPEPQSEMECHDRVMFVLDTVLESSNSRIVLTPSQSRELVRLAGSSSPSILVKTLVFADIPSVTSQEQENADLATTTFSARLNQIVELEADLLYARLVNLRDEAEQTWMWDLLCSLSSPSSAPTFSLDDQTRPQLEDNFIMTNEIIQSIASESNPFFPFLDHISLSWDSDQERPEFSLRPVASLAFARLRTSPSHEAFVHRMERASMRRWQERELEATEKDIRAMREELGGVIKLSDEIAADETTEKERRNNTPRGFAIMSDFRKSPTVKRDEEKEMRETVRKLDLALLKRALETKIEVLERRASAIRDAIERSGSN